MLIFNFLEEFQISPSFSLFIYNSRNFLDFSLSNYTIKVALLFLLFFFVMIINVFSFSCEVNLLVQTSVLKNLGLAIAAIQVYLPFNSTGLSSTTSEKV